VSTALVQPAARQGPGPIPQPLVDALDVAVNRLVSRALPGERRAAGVGLGTELAQLRPYVVGDDVRRIDASATARTGQPHERALTTWIVFDSSPSMAFGTAQRLKVDVAEGAALVFGRLGIRRAGSVGLVAFGAGGVRLLPPRGAKPGMVALRRTLESGVAPDGASDPHALAAALATVGRIAKQPGLVLVISDFRDQLGWERPLGALRLHHAMLAIEVIDPREAELPALGRLRLVDPETGAQVEIDSSRPRIRERFAALEWERRQTIASELRRLRVAHVTLSTEDDWLLELGRALR
jgi:uncharacterized protein (DUF58 family)